MKNVKNLFGMAVMATALVGCSSNDNLNPNANEGVGKAGEAYASFKINLPTTSGTRTDGDPSFNGGEASEYAVKDATLLVFKKSGSDYIFKEAVDLGNMEPWQQVKPADKDKGITTTAKITAKLSSASVNATDYYALILLNNNGNKVSIPATDQTFSAWSTNAANATSANYLKYDKGFFMANAPKYVADGEPVTLVAIQNICATQKEAESKIATTVYVERGLAKVTLGSGSKSNIDIITGTYNGDNVKITGWTLDVTNTKTFPVHVTEGLTTSYADIWKTGVTASTKYGATVARFFDSKLTEFPRVYWGKDPNYSTDYSSVIDCANEFKMVRNLTNPTTAFKTDEDAKKPQYCLENTFDIKHMVQGQTTRVLFSAKYTPKNFAANETFYKMGNNSQLWKEADVIAQIKAKAMEVLGEADADNVEVILTGTDLAKAGIHLITKANVKHGGAEIEETKANEINTKLGFKKASGADPMVGLSTYVKGESYYIARIKHFNELTPWSAGDETYNNQNIDWLGRYGVLRNNWYELSVNSVSGPGYPDIPEVKPTEPDDENYKYINVEVKILDWAKRSQSIDL